MPDLDALVPDSARLAGRIAELAEFRDSTRPGWSREVFSEPYRASRDWVFRQMADAGLEPRTDGAGNIVGRLPGRHPDEPAPRRGHDPLRPGPGAGAAAGVAPRRRARVR
ncbi:MAG: hypothetical protein GEV11_06965 [Streptosporangiales bacterium]|nr:hypothetical protein [Streptosporangiales bacterium]